MTKQRPNGCSFLNERVQDPLAELLAKRWKIQQTSARSSLPLLKVSDFISWNPVEYMEQASVIFLGKACARPNLMLTSMNLYFGQDQLTGAKLEIDDLNVLEQQFKMRT